MSRTTAVRLADTAPVVILALIAGAGSFTHIRTTAAQHGQDGPMAWAVAVCVDLTCVMAARERQRDKKTGRRADGWISWPTLVLVGGIVLSLAANLAQADPSAWGWITAATPAAAFLTAVSMLERRAAVPAAVAVPDDTSEENEPQNDTGTASPLLDYARRIAAEHDRQHGRPITRDGLRARLGISSKLASDLLHALRRPDSPNPREEPA
ncbi:DUF2637 domain-containing protein [Spongiactinospora sp. TRM90649]|uniref:DUF2637 domain-containing protein n=1 Tax=Spongiactinospora sp. TRM90649 TaxID=3031114 RepID=UPI0023F6BE2C|nr:DUF2637 domain-containing protein [Spongiactinospora sp. TRM90649]MDF5757632.1 DUF2637 domain-containing protein [Spongiactinospora sp. TRM90649]